LSDAILVNLIPLSVNSVDTMTGSNSLMASGYQKRQAEEDGLFSLTLLLFLSLTTRVVFDSGLSVGRPNCFQVCRTSCHHVIIVSRYKERIQMDMTYYDRK
jgi:hypothetical protein